MLMLMILPTGFAQLDTMGISTAEDIPELPEQAILPNSPLYGLDRALENLQIIFTRDTRSQAILRLKLAQERLAELEQLPDNVKPEFVDDLTEEYSNELQMSERFGSEISDLARKKEFLALIESATRFHLDILEGLREKLPEEALVGLDNAIENSGKVGDIVNNRIGEINQLHNIPVQIGKRRY